MNAAPLLLLLLVGCAHNPADPNPNPRLMLRAVVNPSCVIGCRSTVRLDNVEGDAEREPAPTGTGGPIP